MPKILSTNQLTRSRIFRIEQLEIEFSKEKRVTYERIAPSNKEAVLVVAINSRNQFVMIREYSCGTERYELTFVKGKVDEGESLIEASQRECQEEIGFLPKNIEFIKKVSVSPSYMSSAINIMLAQDLHESRMAGDEPEDLEVVFWDVDKYQQLLEHEEFTEGRAFAGVLLVMQKLNKISYNA